jgi:RNase adaptor protein for sRNA GlmZ degradation
MEAYPIFIWTWGNKRRRAPPHPVQHNFNVCNVTAGYKPHGVDLRKVDGRDKRLQAKVERGRNFDLYMKAVISKVQNEGVTKIGINCHKGRHRSVAFAELAKAELQRLGYTVVLEHVEI